MTLKQFTKFCKKHDCHAPSCSLFGDCVKAKCTGDNFLIGPEKFRYEKLVIFWRKQKLAKLLDK